MDVVGPAVSFGSTEFWEAPQSGLVHLHTGWCIHIVFCSYRNGFFYVNNIQFWCQLTLVCYSNSQRSQKWCTSHSIFSQCFLNSHRCSGISLDFNSHCFTSLSTTYSLNLTKTTHVQYWYNYQCYIHLNYPTT